MTDSPKTETPRKPDAPGPAASAPRRQAGVPRKGGAARGSDKQGSPLLIPFVFVGFLAGLISTLAAPIVYVYQIIAYNKKNEWPGWSGLDALNHYFFADRPMFFFNNALYTQDKVKVIDIRGMKGLTEFLNEIVYFYLDSSIIFLCLLNGIILLVFSIRTALFRMNKEGG